MKALRPVLAGALVAIVCAVASWPAPAHAAYDAFDMALYAAWSHGLVSGDTAQAIERAAGYDAAVER